MQRLAKVLSHITLALLVWVALLGASHASLAGEAAADIAAIRSLMAKTWDKPDAKLDVGPVIVDGGHAVAGWTQGTRGGRALLSRGSGKWAVIFCSGDALKYASVLIEAGVPAQVAEHLATGLAAAERGLPAAKVTLFSTFEGVARMDGHHDHADQDH